VRPPDTPLRLEARCVPRNGCNVGIERVRPPISDPLPPMLPLLPARPPAISSNVRAPPNRELPRSPPPPPVFSWASFWLRDPPAYPFVLPLRAAACNVL
jgi:hypothetical protein